jgi:predicted benzoate:H+ symporter BenE
MLVGGAMIVSTIGWGYTEIRIQEKLSPQTKETLDGRRIVGYVGVLIVVAAIAVAASIVPAQVTPAIWTIYIAMWLFGGWWLRRRRVRPKVKRDRP